VGPTVANRSGVLLQIDATAFPGKAFDRTFETPEEEVGILTFNRCVAADQWEALARPDLLEKNCHSTCPAAGAQRS
jgi:hypothetical protein